MVIRNKKRLTNNTNYSNITTHFKRKNTNPQQTMIPKISDIIKSLPILPIRTKELKIKTNPLEDTICKKSTQENFLIRKLKEEIICKNHIV